MTDEEDRKARVSALLKTPEVKDRLRLNRLVLESAKRVAAMTPEEREAMLKKQGESWARSEASWPKPRFKMVDGVKVYDSYEDYLND